MMIITITTMMMLHAGPRQARIWLAAIGFAWPCHATAFELNLRCMPDKTLDNIIQDMQIWLTCR